MTEFKTHDALNLSGIKHGFFGRQGGVSRGTYDSLNAGLGSDDDAGHVLENRRRIAASLGAPRGALLSCYQIHSTDVIIADSPWDEGYRPQGDAVVSKTPGIVCSALAADCAPVLFADADNRVVGAAHAGWRGALAGVSDAAIEAMELLGAKRSSIHAVIGPCISAPNYEVGPEFKDAFLAQDIDKDIDQDAGVAKFFTQGAGDRSHFDLKAYLLARLIKSGVGSANAMPDCTYAAPKHYFSYRYNCHNDVKGYGRNISAICLT